MKSVSSFSSIVIKKKNNYTNIAIELYLQTDDHFLFNYIYYELLNAPPPLYPFSCAVTTNLSTNLICVRQVATWRGKFTKLIFVSWLDI